ncbi:MULTISPECIES: phosphatase domain-containing protein [unclassified Corallococcus]|uniref:phosphatase domain-containing protein n=1 Tax=unclassified Corallococcus TaxID=2685029 RepID=UPI001A8E139B|nr:MULTISPECIES: tyrosine-protein phosphatase [unclassified Corallococcus]MBN9684761.1 tyrosine-protein phosphatase [Corallococcus sp. NCSPR001]WAS83769.1 tyrosine-protein phosphatase [Corallococcus sp. NCRR]
MKYTFVFTTAAALLTFLAQRLHGIGWLLLWPALSFAIVALAYAGVGAGAFGKQTDGRMQPWALVALLPYLLLTWGTWHLARRSSREHVLDEVAPGFLVGRRLLPGELPPGVTAVLDLTSEFIEPEAIRGACRYVSLPILDASTLPVEQVAPVLRELAALPGPLYVHCAQGHGRTGMIAAALLVARGDAPDAKTALARVRQARPGVRLSASQERALDALSAALRSPP